MKITTFLKQNINLMLMILTLVLVVIIFRKTMREGLSDEINENDCKTSKKCVKILSKVSDKNRPIGRIYAERLYDHNTKKIYRLKHNGTEWTTTEDNIRREDKLRDNNCCSSKPLDIPIEGVRTAADAAKIAVIAPLERIKRQKLNEQNELKTNIITQSVEGQPIESNTFSLLKFAPVPT